MNESSAASQDRPEEAGPPTPDAGPLETETWERELFGSGPADPRIRRCFGLGAIITRATQEENYRLLAAGTLLMAFTVVMVNRLLWRRLALLAEKRFSLSR